VVQLSLTVEGANLTRKIVPLAKHYEAVAVNCFTKAEVKILRNLLDRLHENAEPLA